MDDQVTKRQRVATRRDVVVLLVSTKQYDTVDKGLRTDILLSDARELVAFIESKETSNAS